MIAAAAAGLFTLYWRQSQSVSLGADGASNVLQSWAMLHGNVLLHNWRVSDVSFYTTELPQYALIECRAGTSAPGCPVRAAMTYTAMCVLGGLAGQGPGHRLGPAGPALLATGLLVAPGSRRSDRCSCHRITLARPCPCW